MAVRDTKNSGSHNASRKYGVICRQEEACIVRKMGVAEKDTAGLGSLGALFSCMRAGDTLCVPGVASFASSAGDLWMKMQSLSARGAGFQSGSERYLDFSCTSPLPAVVAETLKAFASREAGFVSWVQCNRLPEAAKMALAVRIRAESVAGIALVFQNNGIRKKGG